MSEKTAAPLPPNGAPAGAFTARSPEVGAYVRAKYLEGKSLAAIRAGARRPFGLNLRDDDMYFWVDGAAGESGPTLQPLPRREAPKAMTVAARRALVGRLWGAAERQIEDIEALLRGKRLDTDKREHGARMLATLVKSLRELSAIDAAPAKPDKRKARPDDDGPRNIEDFRRELIRKMDALVAGRTAGTGRKSRTGLD